MGYDATPIEKHRFEKFTQKLTELSKKYGIILDVTGGVRFLDPTDPDLQKLTYTKDATSGDLNSCNWYED